MVRRARVLLVVLGGCEQPDGARPEWTTRCSSPQIHL